MSFDNVLYEGQTRYGYYHGYLRVIFNHAYEESKMSDDSFDGQYRCIGELGELTMGEFENHSCVGTWTVDWPEGSRYIGGIRYINDEFRKHG